MTSDEISLKEHFDHRIDALDKKFDGWVELWRSERASTLRDLQGRSSDMEARINERAAVLERGMDKMEQALSARLASMNEFRQTLQDQATRLASREQVDLTAGALEKRIRDVETWTANMQGRLITLSGVWGLIVVVFSVIINFAIRKAFE